MSLILTEGFDATTISTLKGDPTVTHAEISSAAGHNSTKGVRSVSGNAGSLKWDFPSALQHPTFIVGLDVDLTTVPSTYTFICNMTFASTDACRVAIFADGSMNLYVLANNTAYYSSGPVVTVGAFYYIEIKFTVDSSAGSFDVHVNGTSVFSHTGINTGTGNLHGVKVNLSPDFTTEQCVAVDNAYICNGAGSDIFSDFLGPIRLETLTPNGSGAHTDWTPSATTNHGDVSDSDDTTYVSTSTLGTVDTYAVSDPALTTGTPLAAVMYSRAKIDTTGDKITGVARLSGVEVDGAGNTLTTGFEWYAEPFVSKPSGGAWLWADLTNAEFGIKATS